MADADEKNINEWIKGLPLPLEYIGVADLFFYRIAYYIGYYVNYIGISPNMITIFGLICQINTALSIYYHNSYFIITYTMATITDTMDGFNARRFNKQSKYGAFIDHTTDWISGTIIFIASLCRWYMNPMYGIILIIVLYFEYYNLQYCGYILQYNGKDDVVLSRVIQTKVSNCDIIKNLIATKEYNSSTAAIVILVLFYILHIYTI
jgi:phosphatidylglycerophosphate synthase